MTIDNAAHETPPDAGVPAAPGAAPAAAGGRAVERSSASARADSSRKRSSVGRRGSDMLTYAGSRSRGGGPPRPREGARNLAAEGGMSTAG